MINKLFESYINDSKNILSGIRNGISVEEFLEKRQATINSIINLDINKEDKKKVYVSSGAERLDKDIVDFIKNEMKQTKIEMQKAIANKNVYSSYVSNNISGSFFRRTI